MRCGRHRADRCASADSPAPRCSAPPKSGSAGYLVPIVVWPSFNSRLAMIETMIRVAAALAIAVDAALHVRAARFHRGDGIGHRDVRNRYAYGFRARRRSACALPPPFRRCDASGCRRWCRTGTERRRRRFLAASRVRSAKSRIGVVAVEEMLGVVDSLPGRDLSDTSRSRRSA